MEVAGLEIHAKGTPAANAADVSVTADSHKSGSKQIKRGTLMRREPKKVRRDPTEMSNDEGPSDPTVERAEQPLQSVNFPTEDDFEHDDALDELEALFESQNLEEDGSKTEPKDGSKCCGWRRRRAPPPPPPPPPPNPVDCVWSDWEKKGRCQATAQGTCGVPGEQEYERTKTPEKHKGAPCVGKDTKTEEGCVLPTCPPTPAPTEEET